MAMRKLRMPRWIRTDKSKRSEVVSEVVFLSPPNHMDICQGLLETEAPIKLPIVHACHLANQIPAPNTLHSNLIIPTYPLFLKQPPSLRLKTKNIKKTDL